MYIELSKNSLVFDNINSFYSVIIQRARAERTYQHLAFNSNYSR